MRSEDSMATEQEQWNSSKTTSTTLRLHANEEDYVVVVDERTKHMEEIESIGSSGNAPIRPQQILSQMNIHGQSKQARQERLRVLGEQRLHL